MNDLPRQSTELLEAAWTHAREAIVVYDPAGVISYANPATEALSGYTLEELKGLAGAAFIHPEDRNVAFEQFVALMGHPGTAVDIEQRLLTKQGESIWINAHLVHLAEAPLAGWVVSYFRDIKRERSLEDQLMHTQQLMSTAPASAYLAHDLNNLLMLAYGNLDLATVSTPRNVQPHLESVRRALKQASNVSDQLLSIARRNPVVRRGVLVNELIDALAPTFTQVLPDEIRFAVSVEPDCVVFGDPSQLTQVLLNLLNNAREAIGDAGSIELSAAVVGPDDAHATARPLSAQITGGEWVEIRITDDGPGVTAEIKDQLFEPYVSTKGDTGTGLGLAIADRVIREFRGYLDVASEPGQGATFTVHLPRYRAELDWNDELDPGLLSFGSESVLLSVADGGFHSYLRDSLSNLGYRVASSLGGEPVGDELNLSGFDLVIVEANSAAGDPTEVARLFRGAAPNVPLLVISDDEGAAIELIDLTECTTLARPFGVKRLADAARAALDPDT